MELELKHMDIGSRNARLRETLEGMGLYVHPIFSDERPAEIDYLHVSAALPSYVTQYASQQGTGAAIAAPVTGSEVGDVITPAECGRENVINLPTVLRIKPIL